MKVELGERPAWRALLGVVLCSTAFVIAGPAKAQSDDAFLRSAMEGANFEVQLGHLAESRAGSEQVRLLGHLIADDHIQSGAFLRQVAYLEKVNPATESGAHSRQLEQLGNLQGAEFDKAFLRTLTATHKAEIAAFLREAHNGTDIALKQFAYSDLPIVQKHLSIADQLQSKLAM